MFSPHCDYCKEDIKLSFALNIKYFGISGDAQNTSTEKEAVNSAEVHTQRKSSTGKMFLAARDVETYSDNGSFKACCSGND